MGTSILLLACLWLAAGTEASESCLTGEEDPYLWFGSKTAYIFVPSIIPNRAIHDVPGCRPLAFWMVMRHGSHRPENNEINNLRNLEMVKRNVVENYKERQNTDREFRMCPPDVHQLEQWSWNQRDDGEHAGEVTSEGYLNAQRLAQAWKQRVPDLLTNNRHDYLFKYVNEQRASMSLRAFTEGLFGHQAEGISVPKESDERLLRPHKYCPAWIKDVGENNDTVEEVKIFESKPEYKEMISNISRRLGYQYTVDTALVKTMYQMCRYNKAWDVVKFSPWCAVFSKDDLRRLEYAEDLDAYYKFGYGSRLSEKLSCGLIKDMMTFFKDQVDNEAEPQQPRSKIYTGDEATILLLLRGLGAAQDATPLTGGGYHGALAQARRWRTSHMVPYSANVALVLYRCNDNNGGKYRVLFLSNERPLSLEGCRVGLCEWGALAQRYQQLVDTCDYIFCSHATDATPLALLVVIAAAVVTRFTSL